MHTITNPRRMLCIGAPDSGILTLLRDLTGTAPALNDTDTIAGLTHSWSAKTAYYTAEVPIWIDEISDISAWEAEFLKPEAKEVVQAVGA
ncbi:hypothetical protein LTR28_007530, partial [Elasticomyces elasticus]